MVDWQPPANIGWLPQHPDDGLDLDVAALKARPLDIPAAMNNSFGFGGHNVALVFTRV